MGSVCREFFVEGTGHFFGETVHPYPVSVVSRVSVDIVVDLFDSPKSQKFVPLCRDLSSEQLFIEARFLQFSVLVVFEVELHLLLLSRERHVRRWRAVFEDGVFEEDLLSSSAHLEACFVIEIFLNEVQDESFAAVVESVFDQRDVPEHVRRLALLDADL